MNKVFLFASLCLALGASGCRVSDAAAEVGNGGAPSAKELSDPDGLTPEVIDTGKEVIDTGNPIVYGPVPGPDGGLPGANGYPCMMNKEALELCSKLNLQHPKTSPFCCPNGYSCASPNVNCYSPNNGKVYCCETWERTLMGGYP